MLLTDYICGDFKMGNTFWNATRRRITVERRAMDSDITLTIPAGPKTASVVVVKLNLEQLEELVAQFRARGN